MSDLRAMWRHPERFNLPSTGIAVGWLSPGKVSHVFMESMLSTWLHDASHDKFIVGARGGFIGMQASPRIGPARCDMVREFLRNDEFNLSEWLWMVDSDMLWEPEAPFQLLEAAEQFDAKVIGGLCFAGKSPDTSYPTIYELEQGRVEGMPTTNPIRDYPQNAMLKVGGTGAAFLLIHREVLAKMSQPHEKGGYGTFANGVQNPTPWFADHVDPHTGASYGEDILFCLRAHNIGFPVWVHTGVRIGHHKSYILDEETYLSYEELRKESEVDAA